jgi:glycerol-3-phosphate O-acyltransferase
MRWWYRLLQRLLYVWTRTQVFVGRGGEFRLDPALPVFYVLEQPHLPDLLVLDHECRVRNLPAALASMRRSGVNFKRSYAALKHADAHTRRRSASANVLERLVNAALADPNFDVQLVPVTVHWGRAPGTQDSILKALFAETWQAVSSVRQWLRVGIHGRQTEVHIHQVGSLRELLRGDTDAAHALRRIERIFRLYFYRERTRAIGPDRSHRHTQLTTLLAAREVREAVAAHALANNIAFSKADATAKRYAIEIASDYSYTITQAFMLALDWLTTRVFEGVEVRNADKLHALPNNATLVYVPCHRSYFDAVFLDHYLHRHGITYPHAVAGANLDVPLLGTLLRGLGTFFLRRKIKGNALYTTVFNQYLHQVIERGMPVQYYIEGGRSRSGGLLMPKTGMLGMTVHSYLRSRARPLYFVPVYLGYEKLIEGSSYLAEYSGKPKRGESMIGALLGLRKLAGNYGRVVMNFGEPLRLSTFLDTQGGPWRDARNGGHDRGTPVSTARPPWLRQTVAAVGVELARRINAAAAVHPVNLLALTVLATPKRTADLRDIERQIEHLQFFCRHSGQPASLVSTDLAAADVIARGVSQRVISRTPHPLGDLIHATTEQAGTLAYARNNVIHVFALPALLACLVGHNLLLSRARAREAVSGIYRLMQSELFLPWSWAELPVVLDQVEAALVARGLVLCEPGSDIVRAPPPLSDAHADLDSLGAIIRATVERLFLTLALLQHYGSGTVRRETLEESGHLLLQRLGDLYVFNTPDFAEKVLFAASVRNLIEHGFITLNSDEHLCFDERISTPASHAQLLLAPDVRHGIERLTRTLPAVLDSPTQESS